MTRALLGAGLLVWVGSALCLARWPRLSRPSLAERLRPFHPGHHADARAPRPGSVASIRDLVAPSIRDAGDRVARAFGLSEGAAQRLTRIHSRTSATAFRLRQCAVVGAVAVACGLIDVLIAIPAAMAVLLVLGGPVLAFLVVEQRLAHRAELWQRTTAEELPVVSEQLAMLLNAGFSVGAGINRLAARGQGCVARDLQDVVNRIRQGLSERAALREWADRSAVDSVQRLVTVVTLHGEATDLGRLVSAEARAARRDLQRKSVEEIERRAQQVWVPVTVATLIPGSILLAVPFLAALHAFANA